jgi:hypothetical protein
VSAPWCAGGEVIWEPCLAVAAAAVSPCGCFVFPVRALDLQALDGSRLDRTNTRPVELVGIDRVVWVGSEGSVCGD